MIRDTLLTISDFLTIATRIEPATSSRSQHRQQFSELNSLESPQFSTDADDTLRQTIRDIDREKLP